MKTFSLSCNFVDHGSEVFPADLLSNFHKFAMPTAALLRHMIVDYGLELGHRETIAQHILS